MIPYFIIFIRVSIHFYVDFVDTETAALSLISENSHAYSNQGAYAYSFFVNSHAYTN